MRGFFSDRYNNYTAAALLLWSALMSGIYLWERAFIKDDVMKLAASEASGAFEKDLLFRRWNAIQGGVYAPVTDSTPPNPYLRDLQERDVATPSGKRLTLINPAYMTRQMHEMQAREKGVLGHITSLTPIRPGNAPDPWEAEALRAFETGGKEAVSVEVMGGAPYLRLMRPLVTEESCLKCHASQGYKLGDVRGGLSVSVPMAGHFALMQGQLDKHFYILFSLWTVGGLLIASTLRVLGRKNRELEKSESTLRGITDTALDAIVLVQEDDTLAFWNPSAEKLFGLGPYGQGVKKVDAASLAATETEAERLKALLAEYRLHVGEPEARGLVELALLGQGGTHFAGSLSLSASRLNGRPVVVAMVRDVTVQRRMEREIVEAREAAEAASLAKSEFLANMSHEIRTPMNGVVGMTELALQSALTDEQREYMETVRDSAQALEGLINDILDFSKIEAGKLELQRVDFDLRYLVESTAQALGAQAFAKGLELTCQLRPDVPRFLKGDPGRLRQVLVNLLGNSVKFTEEGEVTLRVEVNTSEPTDSAGDIKLTFTVADTGLGIPVGMHESIFESFKQVDNSSARRFGGTGLGLAIVRRLVQLMGGRVGLLSQEGKGSTFIFTASFGQGAALAETNHLETKPDLRGLEFLVVDDNATNRFILTEALESAGGQVMQAANASQAYAALLNAQMEGRGFALVVLDFQMPEMDGLGLAHMIRENPDLAATRLIMLSSGGHRGDAARAADLGILGFLRKPVRQADLYTAINAALGAGSKYAASAPTAPAVSPIKPVPTGRSRHVLIVEDNIINARLAARVLDRAGHTWKMASSGQEALLALSRERFHAVLMDIQMPDLDGLEVTRLIRSSRSGALDPEVPIIAVTAHAMQSHREACLEAGMQEFIAKPIKISEMLAAIERVTGGGTTT